MTTKPASPVEQHEAAPVDTLIARPDPLNREPSEYASDMLKRAAADSIRRESARASADERAEVMGAIMERIPTVARLYYTGLGARRYRRASTQSGPGEPLVHRSHVEREINRLLSEFAVARASSPNAAGAEEKRGTDAQILYERKLTCEAIDGAIAFGYQNTNPPPSTDHWLAQFWKIGRDQAELEAHKYMLGEACSDLGAIHEALGLDPDDAGGAAPILEAISELKDGSPAQAGGAATIPSGYVLVPIEPTEDMVVNGFESWPDPVFSDPEEWEKFEAMSGCQQAAHKARLCYAAMITATPPAPASAPVGLTDEQRDVLGGNFGALEQAEDLCRATGNDSFADGLNALSYALRELLKGDKQ